MMNDAIRHFARGAIDGAEQRFAVSEEQRLLDEMRHAVAERLEGRCFMRLRQIEVAQGRLRQILDTELAGAAHARKAGLAHAEPSEAELAEVWLADLWFTDAGRADVECAGVERADVPLAHNGALAAPVPAAGAA
jgi:hypothetical protein